jgi:hypothetical protein
MQPRFISFDPWWGGFSNIRMSYEMAAAISVISKRKLILPHKIHCLFLSDKSKKETFFDVWNVLDKDLFTKHFDCVDYGEIEEYRSLENQIHYFHKIENIAKLILFDDEYHEWGKHQKAIKETNFLFCENNNKEDYAKFANNRIGISIKLEDKYIHFPKNLLGYFYYFVYGNGAKERNLIKNKIINGIRYRAEYFAEARAIKNALGNFNAIHIRRNDFLNFPSFKKAANKQFVELHNSLKNKICKSYPLYIATDEKDKNIFNFLKPDFDLFFLEDFSKDLKNYESMCIDQIVCSEAEVFLGSRFSTYSDYINIIRGINNKQNFHRMGTNFNFKRSEYDLFPWEKEPSGWDRLHDFYWKYEKEI